MSLGVLLTVGLALSPDYTRIGRDHGVTTYNNEHAQGIALMAEGDLPAPPEQVRRVLTDFGNHTRWNNKLKESRVLSRGDDWLVVYQRLGLPMISDRDYTARVRWGKRDGGAEWIDFHADNPDGPRPRGGVVRVNTYDGRWELSPIDGRYLGHLELGGGVPGWMSRGRAGKDMPRLFEQIRGQLRYYPATH
jgi:hypothetical protein